MPTKAQVIDIIERTVRTFIAAVSAVMLSAATGITDWTTLRAAGFAALVSGMSAVLGLLTVNANEDPASVSVIKHN